MLPLQERVTLYCGTTPLPVIDSADELEALLLNVNVPLSVPLFVGAKATLSDTLCPALMVNGNETPGIEYCELLLDAEFIVTLPPVAVRLAGSVVELPTSTLPKLSVAGLMLSWPVVVVVPLPLNGIFS